MTRSLLLARDERAHLRARIEAGPSRMRLRRAADAFDDAIEDLRGARTGASPPRTLGPALKKIAPAAPPITVSTSASGSTMTGDLPPSSSDTRFSVSVAALLMSLADERRARERDLVDARMRHERGAGRLAVAGEDVDHARREAGLDDAARPSRSAVSGVCSAGFSMHGAAGRERRAELPRRHHERKVPRNDLRDDADRLAARVRVDAPALRAADRNVDRRAFDLRGPAGHVAEVVARAGHVDDAGHLLGLAVVDALELRELVGVLVDEIGEPPDAAPRAAPAACVAHGPRSNASRARPRRLCRRRRGSRRRSRRLSAPVAGSITGMRSLRAGLHPLAADQQPARASQEGCDAGRGCWLGSNRDAQCQFPDLLVMEPNRSRIGV